jgi:uncharacterized membrane protein YeaQ/YmgE (transglycosylase-associated protein family)
MEIIGFLILGLIAGAIARLLMPGPDPMGLLGTMLLGCVGALVGGFLAKALFADQDGVGLIGSVIGALLVLFLYRAFTGSRRGTRDRVGL